MISPSIFQSHSLHVYNANPLVCEDFPNEIRIFHPSPLLEVQSKAGRAIADSGQAHDEDECVETTAAMRTS